MFRLVRCIRTVASGYQRRSLPKRQRHRNTIVMNTERYLRAFVVVCLCLDYFDEMEKPTTRYSMRQCETVSSAWSSEHGEKIARITHKIARRIECDQSSIHHVSRRQRQKTENEFDHDMTIGLPHHDCNRMRLTNSSNHNIFLLIGYQHLIKLFERFDISR